MKRLVTALILVAAATVVAAVALSAQTDTKAPASKITTGTITAIDGTKVTIAIEGTRADWIKKNAPVKFKVGPGKVIELSEKDVTPSTIVVNTRKAPDMKVGDVITFEKGLSTSGC